MTVDHWLLIAVLSAATIGMRLVGYVAGGAMMRRPVLRRILDVFPGCLIVALVGGALANGGPVDIGAALVALGVAAATRNIIATMALGMLAFVALGAVL